MSGRAPYPEIVMIPGWGFPAAVWEEVERPLADDVRVRCLDLPGHGGRAHEAGAFDLDGLVEQFASMVPHRAVWVGWSLGAMAALAVAQTRPERVAALVMVAGTPRFVQGGDWPHGVAPEVLESFACDLEADQRGTLMRFLALQVRGGAEAGRTLKTLRTRLFAGGGANAAALRSGLEVLRGTDLRAGLPGVSCPVLMVMGERDALVPAAAGYAVEKWLPHARVHVIGGAGHAPFLSHRGEFMAVLRAFLRECAAHPRVQGGPCG